MLYSIRPVWASAQLLLAVMLPIATAMAQGVVVNGSVYGGGNNADVKANAEVNINMGKLLGSVYGGGNLGSVGTFTVDNDANNNVTDGKPICCSENTGICIVTISGNVAIGPEKAMHMTASGGPDDLGHVFGAGKGTVTNPNCEVMAYVDSTKVTISGNVLVKGSVYGGSESGHVLNNTGVFIEGGQIGCSKDKTGRLDDEIWGESYTPPTGDLSELECDSWPFEAPFAPYDPFANAEGDLDKYLNGTLTAGGRRSASDGHTYYGNVYGGGSGCIPNFDTTEGISKYLSHAGTVEGNTYVEIKGGHILTNVYGGCETTNVLKTATVCMKGGTVGVPRTVSQIVNHPVTGYVFGAGKGDQRIYFNKETNVNDAIVIVSGGRVYGSVYGGGEDGHVLRNSKVTIEEADGETPTIIGTTGTSYFDGNVFGGGRGFGGEALTAGNVGGSVELNIKSGRILGSVYGGGRLASVGYGLYLVDEKIKIDESEVKPYGVLRPDNQDDKGNPVECFKRGYITVNISGGTIGNDYEYQYFNPTTDQKAGMPYTTFDYQNHLQYTKGGNVFAGGMGRLYALDGTTLLSLWPKLGKCKQTTLNMTGGTVKGSVYGGAEMGVVAQNATVNIKGGTVGTKVVDSEDATKYYYFGSVFGGGKGSTDNIIYPSGIAEEDKIPISEAGTTGGNVEVNLNDVGEDKKGAIVRQVFGCNDMNGSPKGTVTVHVYATQTSDKENISSKPDKDKETFDVEAVYGGGNLAAYVPTDLNTGKAQVIIDGCGLTSIRQVYGGGNAASTPATDVEVNGTYEIFELFGGGNGADKLPSGDDNPGANVGFKDYSAVESTYNTKELRAGTEFIDSYVYGTGKATVNIKGGTIHRVFGGSNTKGNVRITALTMLEEKQDGTGNPVCPFNVDEAYGGGKSAPMDAEAILHMACIPGLKEAYGGAEAADIQDNVTLNITNGTFERVFGGNNISGKIGGAITVNIEEVGCKPIIIGELYGGGNQAGYSVYGYKEVTENGKKVWKPRESKTDDGSGPATPYDDPQVNVKSFTSIGAIFGGGYGENAVMVGNPKVNINVGLGKHATYSGFENGSYAGAVKTFGTDPVTIPDHSAGKIGAISTVFGGGNAAKVIGDTHVNVGTVAYVEITTLSVGDDVEGYYTRTDEGDYQPCAENDKAAEGTTYYIPVLGADIRGNVYGGGNEAEVTGKTQVNIGTSDTSAGTSDTSDTSGEP